MKFSSQFGHSLKWISIPSRIIMLVILPLIVFSQLSCEKEDVSIASSFYTPLELDDWEVSTPEEQGLVSALIKEM